MKGKLKSAILGFGGIGHVHAAQYAGLKNVELVALCDIDPVKLETAAETINIGDSGKTDLAKLRKYRSYEELVKNEPDVDMIDICLPTDLHCEYACRAMRDGYHVLCEKPMALDSADCRKMVRASEATGKRLMIAQVLRFNRGFETLRKAIESGKYGKLRHLSMRRVGALPHRLWFRDAKRSGGALLDLHLHDIDFIQSVLGKPESLQCFGAQVTSDAIDDAVATYVYPDGCFATAEVSWCRSSFSFYAAAVFEKATLEYENRKQVFVCQNDKEPKPIELGVDKPYGAEIDYFAGCIRRNVAPERALPESTMLSVQLIEAEKRSINAGGKRIRLK